VVSTRGVRLVRAAAVRPDAVIAGDLATWWEIAGDVRAGLDAYRAGRLTVRYNLHLAVGLLAATAARQPGRLEVHLSRPRGRRISSMEAGRGEPVLMLHGLGATKAEFLPIISALAPEFRAIAVDLPGFGDADKPLWAPYTPAFFADFAAHVLDVYGLERAHVLGHSMGGRVALEMGMRHPDRVRSLTLITPSLAWRRARPWAPYLRLVRPELGMLQVAPRAVIEPLVRRMIPGGNERWVAAGIDEFLRTYLDPRGRAAFYACLRHIYLEAPEGPTGFWDRLPGIHAPALFVWGKRDRLVPLAFARHVERAIPSASHVELDCAHVPQFERPAQLHAALLRFLSSHRMAPPRGAAAGAR